MSLDFDSFSEILATFARKLLGQQFKTKYRGRKRTLDSLCASRVKLMYATFGEEFLNRSTNEECSILSFEFAKGLT